LARKILLADDSVTAQNMGRKILADAGYEVITVNNGSAALKKVAEAKPDLIVLDVYMPGYSGLEVCQRLKEAQETARTPILLTVGKLEPFKPEEARRVRAEGFIIKPFEASELLSALSKLEDRIVPRTESSKPGRFARAIAAVEKSGRSGRDGADDDSGWKSRIAFPSKKEKKQAEEEDGDDPAIYNAVNRDLRTVIEQGSAPPEKDAVAPPDDHVDAGALGAPGMPHDVSAEEIAAIAAAAAQVRSTSGGIQEAAESESDGVKSTPDLQTEANSGDETDKHPRRENSADIQVWASPGTAPVGGAVPVTSSEAQAAVTFAEASSDKMEARRESDDSEIHNTIRQDHSEAAHSLSANGGKKTALVTPEQSNGTSGSTDTPASDSAYSKEEIPVTMAVGSPAGEGLGTRWMAVPVALDADEAAISLELEMQKACAAFAAAEANLPGFVSSMPEIAASAEAVAPIPNSVTEAEPVACTSEPELSQSMNAVASASAEALGGAVTEFAAIAASHVELTNEVSADNQRGETVSNIAATSGPEFTERPETAPTGEVPVPQEQIAEPSPGAEETVHPLAEKAAEEHVAQETLSAEPIVAEATEVHGESAVGGDMAEKRESDLAASTAAAWASWRQIRETAQPTATAEGRNPSDDEFGIAGSSSASESAAMAVAAGAERAPDEASAADSDDPAAIASIVDSVLADLRPKIVEEISRKLGKRK
jgi:two-component system, chemotaxis family, chemotaxis protein CheY